MVNHVEGHQEITTKNELFKNVKDYFDDKNLNAFHAMPITFYIKVPVERFDGQLKKLLSPFKQVYDLLEEFKVLFDADTTNLDTQPEKTTNS